MRRSAFTTSTVFFGAEVAVRVNHVDPLNAGRTDVKLNWINDGQEGVDLESVLLRRQLGRHGRFEVQGPALQARAHDDGLPLKVRFFGVAATAEVAAPMRHDDTPPRLEVKVEVKLTDRSVASLAALAGATAELTSLTTELAGSATGQVISDVLLTAIPVVSAGVALLSARRAVKTLREPDASVAEKSLAVLRAVADATAVAFPVVGTLLNVALVAGALAWARFGAGSGGTTAAPKTASPATGPPTSTRPAVGPAVGPTTSS